MRRGGLTGHEHGVPESGDRGYHQWERCRPRGAVWAERGGDRRGRRYCHQGGTIRAGGGIGGIEVPRETGVCEIRAPYSAQSDKPLNDCAFQQGQIGEHLVRSAIRTQSPCSSASLSDAASRQVYRVPTSLSTASASWRSLTMSTSFVDRERPVRSARRRSHLGPPGANKLTTGSCWRPVHVVVSPLTVAVTGRQVLTARRTNRPIGSRSVAVAPVDKFDGVGVTAGC